jgi:hypothetical protein
MAAQRTCAAPKGKRYCLLVWSLNVALFELDKLDGFATTKLRVVKS